MLDRLLDGGVIVACVLPAGGSWRPNCSTHGCEKLLVLLGSGYVARDLKSTGDGLAAGSCLRP